MTLKVILFDLDGTLVNSAPDLHNAFNKVLVSHQYHPCKLSYIKPFVSHGVMAMLIAVLGKKYDKNKLKQYHQEILNFYVNNICTLGGLFPGIELLIKQIKNHKLRWGIVTNKPEKFTKLLLNNLKINPDIVVSGDTCQHNKPHPQPLLYACKQLNASPAQTLFIGDDIKDMQAGKNAGIKTVAVSYGYGIVDDTWQYNFLIDKPNDLLKIINL